MSFSLDRRGFLRRSAILGGSLLSCSIPLDRSTNAAPVRIDAPVIDQLTVREITDNTHDIFLKGTKLPGLAVSRAGFPEAAQGKTLESEWGLALHIESPQGHRSPALPARLRFHAGCLREQPGTHENRSGRGGRADHQPRSL